MVTPTAGYTAALGNAHKAAAANQAITRDRLGAAAGPAQPRQDIIVHQAIQLNACFYFTFYAVPLCSQLSNMNGPGWSLFLCPFIPKLSVWRILLSNLFMLMVTV